jgi:hypothetical protein
MNAKLMQFLLRLRGPMLPIETAGASGGRLDVCASCRSGGVNPVGWEEIDETRWWVRLRCGACGESHETFITNEQAKRLERDLAPGLRRIAETVERLDRERMLWEVDVFVAALERDLIGAGDFAAKLPRQ